MIKKSIIILNLAIFLGAVSYYFLTSTAGNQVTFTAQKETNSSIKNEALISAGTRWPKDIHIIIKQLISQYSSSIHQTHIQAKLIYMRAPLLTKLPKPKEKNLRAVLMLAFSDEANNILNTWSRMDQYEAWLLNENRTLIEMDALSQVGFLWKKRNELFPLAAPKIWSEEQDNYETAQLNLHREIDRLDHATNITISEKISRLEQSFQQTDNLLTASVEQTLGLHKSTMASILFGMASVQEDLQQRDPQSRRTEINDIRRALGFNEETLSKMSLQDAKRDERWRIGYAYMKSRAELLTAQEQPSEVALQTLRTQFFGHRATTIAREEKQGFFRFERPRYYGRN